MTLNNRNLTVSATRGEAARERILDAAERLLRQAQAEFSMRELAAESGVSFATPFNQFGSKTAIMRALSGRRIDAMEKRYATLRPRGDAEQRVYDAVAIAAAVMLEEPEVNRSVMGWLGSAHSEAGEVLKRSKRVWARALGQGDGLRASLRAQALQILPSQLAFGFRGVLSFWTAGELTDPELLPQALAIAKSLLTAFTVRCTSTR